MRPLLVGLRWTQENLVMFDIGIPDPEKIDLYRSDLRKRGLATAVIKKLPKPINQSELEGWYR